MINLHGIIFLRIMCLCQLNIKLIIAISSVVHIGIILIKLRIFGRYYIIISHGFISSGGFDMTLPTIILEKMTQD